MDILERIHELLDEKFDGKQRLLAEKLGITEAQTSKMLNGVQNFTTRTLVKLEEAFGAPIFEVTTNSQDFDVVQVKCAPGRSMVTLNATEDGDIQEEFTTVTSFAPPEIDEKKLDLA
ncbi:MAG: helix-turn-helix transcriptional regulator [Bacteroidota bacterium]